jgi:GNAT superfamily N-acetyltransferase
VAAREEGKKQIANTAIDPVDHSINARNLHDFMTMPLTLLELHGADLTRYLDDLGRLRIAVFRDYPYLYDGSLEYEREYLQSYVNCDRSLVVLALDGASVVGATTCMPMVDEGPEFQAAFIAAGYDLASILLSEYRGRGLGKEFFARREAHARRLGGIRYTTFCAVDRPTSHPQQPANYQPLNGLWIKQGYAQHPELSCSLIWKEIDEAAESPKQLTFWIKEWSTL